MHVKHTGKHRSGTEVSFIFGYPGPGLPVICTALGRTLLFDPNHCLDQFPHVSLPLPSITSRGFQSPATSHHLCCYHLVRATLTSYLYYHKKLLTAVPTATLCLLLSIHSPARRILLNLSQSMSLLSSESYNGFLPHSEQKPESLQGPAKPFVVHTTLTSPHCLSDHSLPAILPHHHPAPASGLLAIPQTCHARTHLRAFAHAVQSPGMNEQQRGEI